MSPSALPVIPFGDDNVDANQLNELELIDDSTDGLGDEDAVLDPEYIPFQDLDGIEEDDNTEEDNIQPPLPRKLQFDESDARLRPYSPRLRLLSKSVREERYLRFRTQIQLIIAQLKLLVLDFWVHYRDRDNYFRLFTTGFASLLKNADPDFLLDTFLNGVPEVTRLVLGKKNFTIGDILSLPRLPDTILSEKGIYVDMVKGSHADSWAWKSYVGSGSGRHGILQRWYSYIGGTNPIAREETGRHSRAIFVQGRTVNLRCLAHYGNDPIPWLNVFAESIFMLFLGTINDPIYRDSKTARFVHTRLYEAVNNLRNACQLDKPLAPGLNSTWSLLQGWRRKNRCKYTCQICGESAESKAALGLPPPVFISIDPSRPDESSFRCVNCYHYFRRHGVERPTALAAQLLARDQCQGKFNEAGFQVCEVEDCGKEIGPSERRFDSIKRQWTCKSCHERRRWHENKKTLPPKRSRAPKLCQGEACNNELPVGKRYYQPLLGKWFCIPCDFRTNSPRRPPSMHNSPYQPLPGANVPQYVPYPPPSAPSYPPGAYNVSPYQSLPGANVPQYATYAPPSAPFPPPPGPFPPFPPPPGPSH